MTKLGSTRVSSYSVAEGNQRQRFIKASLLVALSIVALTFQVTASNAQNSFTPESVTVSNLSGSWVISLVGVTGCGQVAMRALAPLNSSGKTNSATLTTHGECQDATTTESFNITSLQSSGTGTAHLSCGEGCGWDFDIQVGAGNNVFNLVDVTNGQNYLAGVAIRKQ